MQNDINDWARTTTGHLQMLAGEMLMSDVFELRHVIVARVSRLPPPPDVAREVCLRALLLGSALDVLRHCHSIRALAGTCACSGTLRSVHPLAHLNRTDPRVGFTMWVDEFFDVYSVNHPLLSVEKAAHHVRRAPSERWSTSRLAEITRISSRRLGNDFLEFYGISIATYVELVRVCRAVPLLLENEITIEGVADGVGYASKKDFYRAMKRTVGLTPAQIRHADAHLKSIIEMDVSVICRKITLPLSVN
jgi:AraC-like DNA-binding protein